ncbi:hypothetical protein DID88_003480 [Monilinia fructigena]|uniref:Rhodopsin domain-containing protein n=1 Tax=Monilinia fructigena TaxID=38457 RepID=A0A395IU53_9HELO|nr:hypothetical protein DID88_003480 [Monilinia fructigena]
MDAQAMAAEFPPGYLESYDGHKLVAICVTAIVLDLFFFAARFTSRWIHNTPKGWDDFLMIPALVFTLMLAAEGLVGITYCGVGYHVEYIELTAPHKLIRLYKLLIFFPATYAIAVTFPKLSILAICGYVGLAVALVYRLNMTRKVKIGLGLTLLTGSSGLATSVLRFVSFTHQSIFPDTPRASVNIALYTVLETSMYIVAACLPACRPLFNIIRHPSRSMPNQHDQKKCRQQRKNDNRRHRTPTNT